MRIDARRVLLIAGIIVGLFVSPVARAAFHVTLECSADVYALGDTVRFTWSNDTDSTLVSGNHPPYEIYTDDGELIYWGPLPWEYHLAPHTAVELTWDQLDGYGVPVPMGAYVVHIGYVFNDAPPGYGVTDEFSILTPATVPEDGSDTDAGSWGEVKSVYR